MKASSKVEHRARVTPKMPIRQPGSGNGKDRRTPEQLARQERVFDLSVMRGKTVREIAADVGVTQTTVIADLRHEQERRSEELGDRRPAEQARAVNFYAGIIAAAMAKSDLYDTLLKERAGAKISDHSLDAAIKARERIDKLLGLDAPTKIDIGVQTLLEAISDVK